MKKINLIIIATFSLMAMALVSCNKDITLQEIEQGSAGTISVSVDGIMGEYAQGNETKAGLVSTTRVSWSAGDKVYVYDGANCLGELTVSLKDGKDYYAVLTGESITAPQAGTAKLTLVYSNATVSEISNGKVSVDISAQEGDTTPASIPFVAFGTLDYTSGTQEISGQIADFSLATSLMRLNCTGLEASTAISGAKLTGMSNECVLNITKDGITIGEGAMGDIAVSFTGVSANAKGTQTLYVAVAKNGTATAQELEIYQDNRHTYSFGSKAREAGKAFNAICQLEGFSGKFTVDAEGRQVFFSRGNLYYDGSSFQFEKNQYDVHGYDPAGNTWGLFGWSTSATNYGMSVSSSNMDYSGIFVDWGDAIDNSSTWRTLTQSEWKYLFNTPSRMVYGKPCYSNAWSGVNIDGKTYNGIFLYPDNYNGNVVSESMTWDDINSAGIVFLPRTGYRSASNVIGNATSGCYWSSFAYDGETAFRIDFSGDNVNFSSIFERRYGCAVRLVMYLSPAPRFTISFHLNGKTGVAPESYKNVINGATVPKPVDPIVDGFGFTGWYKDKACTTLWDFSSDLVTDDITLYAGWRELPSGALSGQFSVSDDKQVYFSKGNLTATVDATGAPTSWKFASNQYDCVGSNGANTTIGTAAGDVDLFGWSSTATAYGVSASGTSSDYSGTFVDWGNSIDNNGTWRTLSSEEWQYLFNTSSRMVYGKPCYSNALNGISIGGKIYNGAFLYPDEYNGNVVSESMTWDDINSAGIVFLPAAGSRYESSVGQVGKEGYYWTTSTSTVSVYILECTADTIRTGATYRAFSVSVRLVTDVE